MGGKGGGGRGGMVGGGWVSGVRRSVGVVKSVLRLHQRGAGRGGLREGRAPKRRYDRQGEGGPTPRANVRVRLHSHQIPHEQTNHKTQAESQWIVRQSLLSTLTVLGFNLVVCKRFITLSVRNYATSYALSRTAGADATRPRPIVCHVTPRAVGNTA